MTTWNERHPHHLVRITKLGMTCVDDGQCDYVGEFVPWATIIKEREETEAAEEPDGWVIIHHRAVGTSCFFGPFNSLDEAATFRKKNAGVHGAIVPMYRTVDWSR